MKRYAIVRVDDDYKHICPSAFEKVDDSSFCKLAIRKGGSCNVCPYGDTKEQMVLKVSQALKMAYEERTGNYGYSLKFYEPMARKIVEFLGVE